jgi:hypothetical protein
VGVRQGQAGKGDTGFLTSGEQLHALETGHAGYTKTRR